jgi:hypothetical protein
MPRLITSLTALLLVTGAASAQSLGDPTQPPAILAAPVASGAGQEARDPSEPAALQLQSILVSREAGGRRVAVINGEVVRAGARIGDAVVVNVGETTVVVRRGHHRETLRLFPATAGKTAGK